MRPVLAALGLAGIIGCGTYAPTTEVRGWGPDGRNPYEWQTLVERRTAGRFPSYELHAKYREPGEKHWSELQAKVELIGTPQEYATMAVIKDGRRLHMTDGRAGPRDDKPDEAFADGVPALGREYHGGDAAEAVWLLHAVMSRMPLSKAFTDSLKTRLPEPLNPADKR
jgi:hypothetical protein